MTDQLAVAAPPARRGPSTTEPTSEHLLREYRRTGDRSLRNRVVLRHERLAIRLARPFSFSSEPHDDLVQVGLLGLVKAAERFDPDAGFVFEAFASVTIRGELRRHLRDHGWGVRVPRRLQELRYEIRAATDVLSQRLGRSPTTKEVAAELRVSSDEVIDALCADSNYRSKSIDERYGTGPSIADLAGTSDDGFDIVEGEVSFESLMRTCPARLRRIVQLRYIDGLTQAEIGARLRISQVHVSRLLAQAHRLIRQRSEVCDVAPSSTATASSARSRA